ncbi:uncharacterized protein Tco025E_04771 [Trypanosoma conorhini]|uniref:Uncharacterized protein n=1 Tax=Trypanosoma conorhini TaxID=83891 RepID=A0A3R7L1E6_9TRYP|nr:uncharacterized protein Tco025E_04771 [Trypanosoma conorhini]RNF17734.1 hypothetical protein Tco025E_04771 [Trypanosoma conorhini]
MQRPQLSCRGEAARMQRRKQPPVPGAGKEPTAAVGAEGAPPRHAVLESALVKNLKKQITCLEMEVAVLKGSSKTLPELNGATTGNTCAADAAARGLGSAAADTAPTAAHARVHPSTLWDDAGEKEARRRESLQSANAASLQFTAQRLRLDKEALEVRLRCEQEEKQKLSMENARLLLALRESRGKGEEAHRRLAEALSALNTEQGRRREVEDKLRVPPPAEGDAECREDIFSEKEYYRVQTDRLRVAQQDGLVCIAELEKQLKTERARAAEAESQLCAALEEVRRLNSLAAERSSVYESLDKSYAGMCTLLQMAVDDCDALQHQLRQRQPDAFSPASSVSITETLRGLEQISSALKKEVVEGVRRADGGKALDEERSLCGLDKATFSSPPPAAAVPPPPAAAVPPPPPAAAVPPPPPAAAVPPPPAAAVPPPPPAAAVPPPPAATAVTSVSAHEPPKIQETSLRDAIDDELENIERRIREEEASLLAYLNSR